MEGELSTPTVTRELSPRIGSRVGHIINEILQDKRRPSTHSKATFEKDLKELTFDAFEMQHDPYGHLPTFHALAVKFVRGPVGVMLMSVVILVNVVLIVYETDERALHPNVSLPSWLTAAQMVLSGIYVLEVTIRIYLMGWSFFRGFSGNFDLFLVIADLLGVVTYFAFSAVRFGHVVQLLKVLRLGRVLRIVRVLESFRELSMLMNGLAGALRAIFWAAVMICLVLMVFAIFFVEFMHPLVLDMVEHGQFQDCPRCHQAISSVPKAVLTFIQTVIAGDSWGELAVPLIEEYPLAVIPFVSVMLIVQIGLLNLVLAVIVDRASDARKENTMEVLRERAQLFRRERAPLLELFKRLDQDEDGHVTLSELLAGYDSDQSCRALFQSLGISRQDLHIAFEILAETGAADESGVAHKEFVQRLHRLKTETTGKQTILDIHSTKLCINKRLDSVERDLSRRLDKQDAMLARMARLLEGLSNNDGATIAEMATGAVQAADAPAPPVATLAQQLSDLSTHAPSMGPHRGTATSIDSLSTVQGSDSWRAHRPTHSFEEEPCDPPRSPPLLHQLLRVEREVAAEMHTLQRHVGDRVAVVTAKVNRALRTRLAADDVAANCMTEEPPEWHASSHRPAIPALQLGLPESPAMLPRAQQQGGRSSLRYSSQERPRSVQITEQSGSVEVRPPAVVPRGFSASRLPDDVAMRVRPDGGMEL